jgi:hypothetical protein
MQALRIIVAILGGVAAVATASTVLKTLVTPGARVGRLFALVDRILDSLFRFAGRGFPAYEQRARLLALQAPVELIALLATWMVLFLLSFALILWPATRSLPDAILEAGSSMFTLGFAFSKRAGPEATDFIAAATGMTVVALQIAYLPTLYAEFNRRETEVTLMTVRGGQPAWGPELLARSRFTITTEELPVFYHQWERWAAEVAESHSSYPILLRFRSADPMSSWLVSFLAVMDSAALWLAVAPDQAPVQARLCLSMGFRCLRQLASTLRMPHDEDPRPDAGIQLTREEFDRGIARLMEVNFVFERDPDAAWLHFQGWRVNYEPIAYRLAWAIDAVPAEWSGPRRSGEPPIARRRIVNRTPDRPEGAPPAFRAKP